jgi:hypothetical protein
MKRTDANGHVGNLFFDGDPGSNTPATALESTWCNNVQEELANIVESVGVVLDGGVYTQLLNAINEIIQRSGIPVATTVSDNVTNTSTGITLDKTKYRSAVIRIDGRRRDDNESRYEVAQLVAIMDKETNTWLPLIHNNYTGDIGVTYSINSTTGEITYSSDDMGGANYSSSLRMSVTEKHLLN